MFYLILLLFLSWFTCTKTVQPYFPPDITFRVGDSNQNLTYAIDATNQRAFFSKNSVVDEPLYAYIMKHFPYATPDSPQSKYYVVLRDFQNISCEYSTFWKYGGVIQEYAFPAHWFDDGQVKISNYAMYSSEMIHSKTSSPNEDYWYSSDNCTLDSGVSWPCEEVYFKKNTDIPLRYRYIDESPMHNYQYTLNYHIISIGKPDDRYFQNIPKNWPNNCTDLDVGLYLNYSTNIIPLHESILVGIELRTPPHRMNGNDTMILEWKVVDDGSGCMDCITWEPKQFYFNTKNFNEFQNLTVTRVKNGSQTEMYSIQHGGGYDKLPWYDYTLFFKSG